MITDCSQRVAAKDFSETDFSSTDVASHVVSHEPCARAAAAAVDWALQCGLLDPADGRDPSTTLPADREGPARAGTDNPKSLVGACSLPEPYCQPFRQMIAHPPVLEVRAAASQSCCYGSLH